MKRVVGAAGAVAVLIFAGCDPGGSGDGASARVTRVIDGDTVVVERLGKTRLIGVDTPEKKKCGDDAATRFTEERLLDQVVQYELGEERTDRYGRTLAYLSREGKMHNLALLEGDYARVLTIPPNDKYAEEFENAEREAEVANTGALAICDRDRRRAALRRQREEDRARRARTIRRERARAARRIVRAEERRARRAARRRAEAAREREFAEPEEPEDSGSSGGGGGGSSGGGGSCLSQAECPGKRDGDGDGCYCE